MRCPSWLVSEATQLLLILTLQDIGRPPLLSSSEMLPMSFKTKGVLKSGDKAGAGTHRKRVHFADESVAGENEPAFQADSQKGEAQKPTEESGRANGAPDFVEEFRVSCSVNEVKACGSWMQERTLLQDSCPGEDRDLNGTASSLQVAAAAPTSLFYQVEDNCCVEEEGACTPPPACVTYGFASSRNIPRPHPRGGGVQRSLDFAGDSRKHCDSAAYGFPATKKWTKTQNCNYKVVPEGEVGGLNAIVLGGQHDAHLQMQVAFEGACCRKRCAWITPQSDPAYVAYHDEEWGMPVHDDRRLFELLVFAGAQAEVAWPCLLANREAYRNIFQQFDPTILAALDVADIASLRAHDDIMRREARVQTIVDNAKLVVKIAEEYGSFDAYLWAFVGNKPIVSNYKQPSLIPARTGKSAAISKDMQGRGFRHTGPIVVYAMMQAAGLANAHLVSCFRHHQLLSASSQPPSPRRPHQLARHNSAARKSAQGVTPLCY